MRVLLDTNVLLRKDLLDDLALKELLLLRGICVLSAEEFLKAQVG